MKQTMEMKKAAFEALMLENGFERTGETALGGEPVYARAWTRVAKVAFYGNMESSFRITAHESAGVPVIQTFDKGKRTSTRDYSSPKRAMNAIKEIVRFAGYAM
ncbi:hypothetical protein HNQ56_001239 [Anaerotaenia torta]|uniref:hypothetical protein n=1 Tax=Anaerotaenia torta TaxID=433293 RepID=UPI003D1EDC3C